MTTKACDFVVTTGQELGSGLAHGLGPDSLVRLQLRWRPGRPTLKAALGLAGLLPGRLCAFGESVQKALTVQISLWGCLQTLRTWPLPLGGVVQQRQ